MRQLLIAAVLVTTACGGSTTAAAPSSASSSAPSAASSAASPSAGGPTVRLVDFALDPPTLSAAIGSTITVVNAGKSPHNLWVRDGAGHVLAKTPDLAPGQQASFRLDLPAGSYADYCEEPGHESLGMKGSLTIT